LFAIAFSDKLLQQEQEKPSLSEAKKAFLTSVGTIPHSVLKAKLGKRNVRQELESVVSRVAIPMPAMYCMNVLMN
jgi:hypothetical protein